MPERMLSPHMEFKFDGDAPMSFEGYGAVFGNVDSYGDVIEPGAFKASLRDHKRAGTRPVMLSQHGFDFASGDTPIGMWDELTEDDRGLVVKGRLADTTAGRDIHTLMKMKALGGLSIGFFVKDFAPAKMPDDPRRRLTKLDLIEVSVVTWPANAKAKVTAVKSQAERVETKRQFEDFLRDAGFSRARACEIASRGWQEGPGEQDDADRIAELMRRMKKT